jgi:uncharacterized protein YutE (UPF0331/DUF86 family)
VSPLDAALVRRKLALIARNLQDLEPIAGLTLEAYRSERFRQKGTERLLQELIEAASDVNLHVLRVLGRPAPADYYSSFIDMGGVGFITEALAARIAPAAGLRNRLVHEYDRLDDGMVQDGVRRALGDFREYVAAVERALTERGA